MYGGGSGCGMQRYRDTMRVKGRVGGCIAANKNKRTVCKECREERATKGGAVSGEQSTSHKKNKKSIRATVRLTFHLSQDSEDNCIVSLPKYCRQTQLLYLRYPTNTCQMCNKHV